jgi:hypothetical protein
VFSYLVERLRRRHVVLLATCIIALCLVAMQAASANAVDRDRVELVNVYSGLRADVMWASTSPFQGVLLWPDNASASQEFDLLDSGGGYFRIRARHSGQCLMLDWRSSSHTNGSRVIQYPYCDAGLALAEWSGRWLRRCSGNTCDTGADHWIVVNRQTGLCLDADNSSGGAPPVQAVLQQWDCVTSVDAWNLGNQSWDVRQPGTTPIDPGS